MPRKPASENVVCFRRLLNILAKFETYFCIQAISLDADQTAPRGKQTTIILIGSLRVKVSGQV